MPPNFRGEDFSKFSANRNKNWPWWPCFLSNQDETRKSYRRPSIHASFFLPSFCSFTKMVSEIIRNQPTRNKNCLWWPCLNMDRDEMSNLYRGPSIAASYQVLAHLEKLFQRRRFLLEIYQPEARIFYGSHVCSLIGTKWAIFIEDLS